MRDILFRGKRIDSEEYDGTWIEGIPIKNHIGLFMCFDENPHYCSQYGYMEIDNVAMVDESTLCRYTGLTDKNNRKIFEGDIIIEVDSGNIGIIKFGLYKFKHYGFYIEWMRNCGYRQDIYHWTSYRMIRVIGNIFDNPELLEAGQQSNADVLLPAT